MVSFFTIVMFSIWGTLLLSEKISADLIVDMAERGYYQKEINNKILWVKDEI